MNTLTLPESLQEIADRRRAARMQSVDGMPEDWRALVHAYGFNVVHAMQTCGVKKAAHCRHLIETVLDELSPIRGSKSSQGTRCRSEQLLVLTPIEPTDAMIDASMATVSGFDVHCSKREKHRLRLRAALQAARRSRK